MKKLALIASLAAVFGTVGLAQAASTGTISFAGELTSSTCDVKVNGGTANGLVTLPTLGAGQLASAGSFAGETKFDMSLANCSLAAGKTQVAAFFQSGTTVDANGWLKNDDRAENAQNVVLQLLEGDNGSVIAAGSLDQVNNAIYKSVVGGTPNGTAALRYGVRYYSPAGSAVPGFVSSSVVYSIMYK